MKPRRNRPARAPLGPAKSDFCPDCGTLLNRSTGLCGYCARPSAPQPVRGAAGPEPHNYRQRVCQICSEPLAGGECVNGHRSVLDGLGQDDESFGI